MIIEASDIVRGLAQRWGRGEAMLMTQVAALHRWTTDAFEAGGTVAGVSHELDISMADVRWLVAESGAEDKAAWAREHALRFESLDDDERERLLAWVREVIEGTTIPRRPAPAVLRGACMTDVRKALGLERYEQVGIVHDVCKAAGWPEVTR